MKPPRAALLPLLVAASLAAGAHRPGPVQGPVQGDVPFPWRGDLGQARVDAAAAGKPLLVVVRCPP